MKRESLTRLAPDRKSYERISRAVDDPVGHVPKEVSEGLRDSAATSTTSVRVMCAQGERSNQQRFPTPFLTTRNFRFSNRNVRTTCSVQPILSQPCFARSIKALRAYMSDLIGHNVPAASIDRIFSPSFGICPIRLNFCHLSPPGQIVHGKGASLA